MFKFLCFPVDDDVVPSFFPLRDSSGILAPSVTSCPSPISFLPICPLSARFCVFSRPPPVYGPPHRPSPIVRPSESYQPSGVGRPMSSSVFPTQRPICRFAPPLPTCAAGGTWLGCGWRGEGDGAPRGGLESVISSFVARESVPLSTLGFPLDSCGPQWS